PGLRVRAHAEDREAGLAERELAVGERPLALVALLHGPVARDPEERLEEGPVRVEGEALADGDRRVAGVGPAGGDVGRERRRGRGPASDDVRGGEEGDRLRARARDRRGLEEGLDVLLEVLVVSRVEADDRDEARAAGED